MLRPALARRLAHRRRSALPDIWLAWLRLSALIGLAIVLTLLLFGEKVQAEESVRMFEVATAEDPQTTGALGQPDVERPLARGSRGRAGGGSMLVRPNASMGCVPGDLKQVVADVAARFGPVSIESTHRSRAKARRNGAPRSLHVACRAIDFRVRARSAGVMAYLRSRPEVGGLKMYRTGIIHIDNGERRRW